MKIRDVNQNNNVVDRLFDRKSTEPILTDDKINESGMVVHEVPINQIKPRPVNKYVISGIKELAESIERTGQWQPIIIRVNPNKNEQAKYIIVAGERRFTAIKYLNDKYKKEKDTYKEQLFETIKAVIISAEDENKEELIYSDTNDFSRQLTIFERIIRLDPQRIRMDNDEEKKKVIIGAYGENAYNDWKNGKRKIKFNQEDIANYIKATILKKEPNLDITIKTIRNYLNFINKANENLLMATVKGDIPLREARIIAELAAEEQQYLLSIKDKNEEEYLKIINKEISLPLTPYKQKKKLNNITNDIEKKLLLAKKNFISLKGSINEKNLNGNEKEYIKQMSKVIKEIEILEKMPKK